jgi:uncharacterized membrane protein
LSDTSQGSGDGPQNPSQGSPSDTPAPSAPYGVWRWLLIGSLALNLLFAGTAAGGLWHGKRFHHTASSGGRGAAEMALQGFIHSLPKERAKELRRVIKQAGRPDILPLIKSVRQARREAADVLSADTFDKTKLVAAFSNIDAAEAATKAATRGVVMAAAEHMTAPERRALTERWKARRPHLFLDPPEEPESKKKKKSAEPTP